MLQCYVCNDFGTGVHFSYGTGFDGYGVIWVGGRALFATNMLLGLCAMHCDGGEGSRAERLLEGCEVRDVSNWLGRACKGVLYTYICAVDLSGVVSQVVG